MRTSSPGRVSVRSATWLAMTPVANHRPASCPRSRATRSWRALTVGSSPNWSSPTSARAIASRIAGDGRVTVSERRSTSGPSITAEAYDARPWRRLSPMPDDRPIFGRDVPDAAWRPTRELRAEARLASFLRTTGIADPASLQARAVADPAWFWGAAADDLGLAWQRPPVQVMDTSGGPEWTRWWRGGAFNHADASTEPRAARDPSGESIAWEGEDGEVRRLTNAALLDDVVAAARMFRAAGVRPGDRVGIFLPMLVETVVATLALGRIGAIYTPIFSGYGAPAVAARLRDCEATVLVTADGFFRRGAIVPMKAIADEAVALAPSVRRLIVVRRFGERAPAAPWDAERDRWWDASVDAARAAATVDEAEPESAADTDPETPYMLIYTSGTTGKPKGAVHVHGGFPIKAAQDLAHTFDLRPGDALFWFTDLGWMMGPWAISGALLLGARLILYEGAPDFPDPGRLWSVA